MASLAVRPAWLLLIFDHGYNRKTAGASSRLINGDTTLNRRATICCVLAGWIGACSVIASAAEPLRLVATIPMSGVEGRIDHLAVDVANQRLFVAALGNNTLEVIDTAAHKVIQNVAGLHEPQGVAFLKDRRLVAVASGDDGTCRLFDAKTLIAANKFDFQSDADNVRYDAKGLRLYVGFGDGAIGAVDISAQKRLADIKLPGHPESFQLELNEPHIYVNVPKSRQVVVIDRKQSKIVTTWALEKAEANFPMALDEQGHRLYVGCRAPAEVLVYDTNSGKLSDRFPTVGDTDDLFYDVKTRRLYVCGGEGFIFVHQHVDKGRYTQLAKIPTAAGARTGLFVPDLAHLFVAVPHRGSQAAELREYEVVP
jgi:YVTN family beta-propeller protein